MTFEKTLKKHMEAMKEKDLKTFLSTIQLDEITLIMPNGNLIQDGVGFKELHEAWFEDEDWHLDYKVIRSVVGETMSMALMAIDYHDCDVDKNPVEMTYYLQLVFKKYGDHWLLIHDQNTLYTA